MKKNKIIDSYDILPLGTYLDIVALCREEMEEADRQVKIVSLLSGIDEDALLRMPIADFRALSVRTRFLETEAEPGKRPVTRTMQLGDMTVRVTTKVTDITTAQYIDFQTFSKDAEHLVELLACFLIPEGCDYGEGYDMDDVYTAIRDHLTVTEAQSLAAFFFSRWTRLIGASLLYSVLMAKRIKDKGRRKEVTEKAKEAWTDFRRSGVGSPTWTPSLLPSARRGIPFGR